MLSFGRDVGASDVGVYFGRFIEYPEM